MTRSLGIQQNLRRITLLVALAAIASLYLFGADALAQSSKQLMKPTGLEGAVVTAGIQLDWTTPRSNVDEISGYKLERRRPGHGESRLIVLVNDTGSTDTTYVDSTAAAEGTEFIYRVRAVRGSALSARSNKLVVTWNAADAVDTSDGNTVDFVDGDDDQQESLRHNSDENHDLADHADGVDICGGSPSFCLPSAQYYETSVDTTDWWSIDAYWSLRIRPPSFMRVAADHYEYDYRRWTGRSWSGWFLGGEVDYVIGTRVTVDLNNDPCGKYVQHRVRLNWNPSGETDVTDYVYTDTVYIPSSTCTEDPMYTPVLAANQEEQAN